MNKYCLIKKSDLTREQINFSTNTDKKDMPIRTSREYLLWFFSINTKFYIVELPASAIRETTAFRSVRWFSQAEMLDIIDQDI